MLLGMFGDEVAAGTGRPIGPGALDSSAHERASWARLEPSPLHIRDAVDDDLPALRDLNALIPTTTVAWTESLQTLRERHAWSRRQQRFGNPVLVGELRGEVVGFAAYGSFRGSGKWPGYRHTVEHTIH